MALFSTNETHYQYHIGSLACTAGENHADVPCFRAVFSGTLALTTLGACCVKLVWAYRVKAARVQYYFVLCFALAIIELGILAYKWLVGGRIVEHFFAIYLHVIQFLLLTVYYCERVLTVNKRVHLISRLCYPVATLVFAYFTTVLGLALTHLHSDRAECESLVWILFSGSMVGLAALFVVLGVLLTRAMNKFPTSDPSLVWWRRVHLWSLIAAYSLSSVIDLSFDLAFQYCSCSLAALLALLCEPFPTLTPHSPTPKVAEDSGNCDTVYGGPSSFGYTMYVLTERLSLLGPLWVMLAVLKCGSIHTSRLNDSQVSAFRQSGSTGTMDSLDSAVQWDPDDLAYSEVNGVFDDDPSENSRLLVALTPRAHTVYQ